VELEGEEQRGLIRIESREKEAEGERERKKETLPFAFTSAMFDDLFDVQCKQ